MARAPAASRRGGYAIDDEGQPEPRGLAAAVRLSGCWAGRARSQLGRGPHEASPGRAASNRTHSWSRFNPLHTPRSLCVPSCAGSVTRQFCMSTFQHGHSSECKNPCNHTNSSSITLRERELTGPPGRLIAGTRCQAYEGVAVRGRAWITPRESPNLANFEAPLCP